METAELIELIQSIVADRGVPRRIKDVLEDSMTALNGCAECGEKIPQLISILDDASSNPNLSMNARTQIWNIVSVLEGEVSRR